MFVKEANELDGDLDFHVSEEISVEEDAERKVGWLLKIIFVGTASYMGLQFFPYMGIPATILPSIQLTVNPCMPICIHPSVHLSTHQSAHIQLIAQFFTILVKLF